MKCSMKHNLFIFSMFSSLNRSTKRVISKYEMNWIEAGILNKAKLHSIERKCFLRRLCLKNLDRKTNCTLTIEVLNLGGRVTGGWRIARSPHLHKRTCAERQPRQAQNSTSTTGLPENPRSCHNFFFQTRNIFKFIIALKQNENLTVSSHIKAFKLLQTKRKRKQKHC